MKHKITIAILSIGFVVLICLASCKKEPACNICDSTIIAEDVNGVIDETKTDVWEYNQESSATCMLGTQEYKAECETDLEGKVERLNGIGDGLHYSFTLSCRD